MQESSFSPPGQIGVTDSLLGHSEPQKWYTKNFLERMIIDFSLPKSKNRILRNIICMSMCHFLITMTSLTLMSLQSTLNSVGGVGVGSMAIMNGISMVCILFFSDILIKSFGTFKKMMCFIIALQLPCFASNFYPTWGFMATTSALAGATAGLIPMGFSLYINEMSVMYHQAEYDGQSLETITSRFFGIYSFFALNASIWGNLISYLVLMPGGTPHFNHTSNVTCGIDYDESTLHHNDNLQPPSHEKRYILVGICLTSAVLCIVLILAFVDELKLKGEQVVAGSGRVRLLLMSLTAAVRQAFVPDQILLLPLTIFFGMQSAFFNADFTRAYIACSWGVYHIGFVLMCYGACGAVMGCVIGSLVNRTSERFAIITGAIINFFVIILLVIWDPSPDFKEAYFIVAGLWGIFDAIWWTQISAVYGLLFPHNRGAAFSIMYFCLSVGSTFNLSTSNFFTVRVKVALLFSGLLIGMAGYLVGQYRIRGEEKRKIKQIESAIIHESTITVL